ncbi:hypothetical protein M0R45_014060 [Rubus argutus]|uniref:Pentatricopeptide repeat-containing protein n=1 Tax=Rubus argutus TaxID=59490 RepID=A0AAW1XMV4_RUBAR
MCIMVCNVAAYVNNGKHELGLSLCFGIMVMDGGLKPDQVTAVSVLSGLCPHGFCWVLVGGNQFMASWSSQCLCAHRLVEEGRKYFKLIEESGLELRIQHYGCMVDLYGKAGLLDEAYDVIKNMRLEPNVAVWGAFLSACKEHKQLRWRKE